MMFTLIAESSAAESIEATMGGADFAMTLSTRLGQLDFDATIIGVTVAVVHENAQLADSSDSDFESGTNSRTVQKHVFGMELLVGAVLAFA